MSAFCVFHLNVGGSNSCLPEINVSRLFLAHSWGILFSFPFQPQTNTSFLIWFLVERSFGPHNLDMSVLCSCPKAENRVQGLVISATNLETEFINCKKIHTNFPFSTGEKAWHSVSKGQLAISASSASYNIISNRFSSLALYFSIKC